MNSIRLKEYKLEYSKLDYSIYEIDAEVEKCAKHMARMANKHNDMDWWESAEEIAITCANSILYDYDLIKGMAIKHGIIEETK